MRLNGVSEWRVTSGERKYEVGERKRKQKMDSVVGANRATTTDENHPKRIKPGIIPTWQEIIEKRHGSKS